MPDSQNIFYTSISKFYSEIFPFNPQQLNFAEFQLGSLSAKNLLDIGCASGELSFQLAQNGALVTGIDLNDDLIEQARQNKKHPNLNFRKGNMLDLGRDFKKTYFDSALCFGNTLVHLASIEQVAEMLKGARTVLKPGGKLLLQILNYDYILDEHISDLPLIDTENIQFKRQYKWDQNSTRIHFCTELLIKAENKSLRNETILLALRSRQLKNILLDLGFSDIQFYSNFRMDNFGGQHLPLVVSCSA